MKGPWLLSWRHLTYHRWRSAILVLCLATSFFVPLVTTILMQRYDRDLRARAQASPLLLGARGNRFDLVLEALYFRHRERATAVPMEEFERLRATGRGVVVPLHVRFTAREFPIVGTSPEYFEQRGLVAIFGDLPLQVGDVVLGSEVALELDLAPGSRIFSDPTHLYDISRPGSLKMTVCGVLARSGTPDDRAVFVDIKTAWVLEGRYHGHQDAETVAADNPELVIGEAEGQVAFSGALIEANEMTQENAGSFHFHGDPDTLPLTSILVWPGDDRDRTLLSSQVNAREVYEMVRPGAVIDDLMAIVFRVKSLFDRFSAVLLASTLAMTGLVLLLTMRLRAAEMRTLNRIGCAPATTRSLYLFELGLLLLVSLALAASAAVTTLALLPDLVHAL